MAARVKTFAVNFDNTYSLNSVTELFDESEKMAGKINHFENMNTRLVWTSEMEETCNAIRKWSTSLNNTQQFPVNVSYDDNGHDYDLCISESPEKQRNPDTNPDTLLSFDTHQGNSNQQMSQYADDDNSKHSDEISMNQKKRRRGEQDESTMSDTLQSSGMQQGNAAILDECSKTEGGSRLPDDGCTQYENNFTYQYSTTDSPGVDDVVVLNKQTSPMHEEKRDDIIRLCILVVHAYESRLNINEKDAGIGYYKVYQAMKQVANKILVIVGGDDHFGQSEQPETVSTWVMNKLSGQFTEEECNGTKSLIFSWNEACTLHHVHKFLQFLGIKEKIEKPTKVKKYIKIFEINDSFNKNPQSLFRLFALCDIFSSAFDYKSVPIEQTHISQLCYVLKNDFDRREKAYSENACSSLSSDEEYVIINGSEVHKYPKDIWGLTVLVLQDDNLAQINSTGVIRNLLQTLQLVSEDRKVLVIIQSDNCYEKHTDYSKFKQEYIDGRKGFLVISLNNKCPSAHVDRVREMFGFDPKQVEKGAELEHNCPDRNTHMVETSKQSSVSCPGPSLFEDIKQIFKRPFNLNPSGNQDQNPAISDDTEICNTEFCYPV